MREGRLHSTPTTVPDAHGHAAVPLTVTTDLALGGRWTSLRSGTREWLWQNPGVTLAERAEARPGTPFVDAGGGEECFPSVTGDPTLGHDHGDVWCRPWVGEPADASARTRDGLTLRRRLSERSGAVRVDYEITGPRSSYRRHELVPSEVRTRPGGTNSADGVRLGARFLHAVHLLLDLSPAATLRVPGTPAVAVQDHPRPGEVTRSTWPEAAGVHLDLLGPDDGTATCAVVASDAVEILDEEDCLSLRWGADPGVPTSFVLWRNLRGWPAGTPYRSIGIEPMIGATTALAEAGPDECAALPATGAVSWWLEVSTARPRARG
ncbi:hypothetical protein [Pseudactinotalea sp.]|uniref:hypothetical protein n=1 Tax=Pseudactinotalea sp. TaxID=1926260 RepID=UPI003B3BE711